MKGKRLQVILNEEAWKYVESATIDANKDFHAGSISYSDVLNEMALHSKIDVRLLQLKHTDFRKVMRKAAKDGVDLDSAIKMLQELKANGAAKKSQRGAGKEVNIED